MLPAVKLPVVEFTGFKALAQITFINVQFLSMSIQRQVNNQFRILAQQAIRSE
jgi:hypothetical protein